jgi:hypothetical protein
MRKQGVTPHIAQNAYPGRCSAIDQRTVRHPGYSVSQVWRERIEHPFGWLKAAAVVRQVKVRGRQLVDWVGCSRWAWSHTTSSDAPAARSRVMSDNRRAVHDGNAGNETGPSGQYGSSDRTTGRRIHVANAHSSADCYRLRSVGPFVVLVEISTASLMVACASLGPHRPTAETGAMLQVFGAPSASLRS